MGELTYFVSSILTLYLSPSDEFVTNGHSCYAGQTGGASALGSLASLLCQRSFTFQGLPSCPSAPSRPFPDAREVMINSGLVLSPPSAPRTTPPRAHTLRGRSFPTVPSDVGRVHPLPSAPGVRAPFGVLVSFRLLFTGTPPPPTPPPRHKAACRGARGGVAVWRASVPSGALSRPRSCPSPPDRPRVHPAVPQRPSPPASSAQPDLGGAGFCAQKSRGLRSHTLECHCLGRPPGQGIPPLHPQSSRPALKRAPGRARTCRGEEKYHYDEMSLGKKFNFPKGLTF